MSDSLTLVLFFVLAGLSLIVGLALYFDRRRPQKKVEGLYFNSSVGPIFYNIEGKKGPFVLLIHGLGGSSYSWRHITTELSNHYRVVTFDLWGFGNSSKSLNKDMTLDNQCSVISELIHYLKIESFHIVGHSMGAQIGIWMKLQDERVQNLVAITPAAHPNLVSNWFTRFKWIARWTPLVLTPNMIRNFLVKDLSDPASVTDEIVEAYYSPYLNPDAHKTFAAALGIIKDDRVYRHLDRLKGDTLVLWGANDPVIPKKLARKMSEKLSPENMKTHPWSGHLLMEEDPLWLVKQILFKFES